MINSTFFRIFAEIKKNKFIFHENMTKKELKSHIGKIITKQNWRCLWMFKLINVLDDDDESDEPLIVTQGLDILPTPRQYHAETYSVSFNEPFEEIHCSEITRLPTKEELNLYRKYSRELRLLDTNKSQYGNK